MISSQYSLAPIKLNVMLSEIVSATLSAGDCISPAAAAVYVKLTFGFKFIGSLVYYTCKLKKSL